MKTEVKAVIYTNEEGIRITVIPSGFEDHKIVIFEDSAYNLDACYDSAMTDEEWKNLGIDYRRD